MMRRVGKIALHGRRIGAGRDGDFAHAVPRRDPGFAPRGSYAVVLVALAALLIATTSHTQPRRDPGEIHGLKLGLKAEEMCTDSFGDLACGSNGGPPRHAIDDCDDFRKLRTTA